MIFNVLEEIVILTLLSLLRVSVYFSFFALVSPTSKLRGDFCTILPVLASFFFFLHFPSFRRQAADELTRVSQERATAEAAAARLRDQLAEVRALAAAAAAEEAARQRALAAATSALEADRAAVAQAAASVRADADTLAATQRDLASQTLRADQERSAEVQQLERQVAERAAALEAREAAVRETMAQVEARAGEERHHFAHTLAAATVMKKIIIESSGNLRLCRSEDLKASTLFPLKAVRNKLNVSRLLSTFFTYAWVHLCGH